MAALHANTIEAPVYWKQFEPEEGHFDFTNERPDSGHPPGTQTDVLLASH